MKNFKSVYITIIIIALIALVGAVAIIVCSNEATLTEIIALILGGIALIVAIFSVAIADKNLPEIDIILYVWKTGNVNELGFEVSFKIINTSQQPINNSVISIKGPEGVLEFREPSFINAFNNIKYGRTDIYYSDFLKYFNNDNEKKDKEREYNEITYIVLETYVKLHDSCFEKEKRSLFITLAGQELKPKTIKIDKEGIKDILESKYNKKVKFWNDSRKFEETDN